MSKNDLVKVFEEAIKHIEDHTASSLPFRSDCLHLLRELKTQVRVTDESKMLGNREYLSIGNTLKNLLNLVTNRNTSGDDFSKIMTSLRISVQNLPKLSDIVKFENLKNEAEMASSIKIQNSQYSELADTEGKSAFILRIACITSSILTCGISIFLIFHKIPGLNEWTYFLIRIGILGVMIGLSIYFGKIAAKHFLLSRRYKITALDLGTIPNFIAPLPDKDKNEVIKFLSNKMFGNASQLSFTTKRDK